MSDPTTGPTINGSTTARLLILTASLLRDVGFPVLVAAYLLWELGPKVDLLIQTQQEGITVLRSLGTRSCVLPFQRWEPGTPPADVQPAQPQSFRGLGLRHGDSITWPAGVPVTSSSPDLEAA